MSMERKPRAAGVGGEGGYVSKTGFSSLNAPSPKKSSS